MKRKYGFVADLFAHQYRGGAELTTHALMEAGPQEDTWMAPCKEITKQNLQELFNEDAIKNQKTSFIFGNFATLDPNMIPLIMTNFDYYVIEYDYKFCEYRSPEKHLASEDQECDCHTKVRGQIIEQFYSQAQHVFFMSQRQKEEYAQRFPNWDMLNTTVLSSVFSKDEWRTIEDARTLQRGVHRKQMWAYFDSDSWIKGTEDSEEVCWNRAPKHGVVGFKDFDQMSLLNLFSEMSGFAFHPRGGDTCPRIVIEAKLMDCPLDINDNVQHANEDWFANGTYDSIKEYLQGRPSVFWSIVSGE